MPIDLPYDPTRLTPDDALTSYLKSIMSTPYARDYGPLGMLRVLEPLRLALRVHEKRVVQAALDSGATYTEIGDALGMARTNAHRRHSEAPEDVAMPRLADVLKAPRLRDVLSEGR